MSAEFAVGVELVEAQKRARVFVDRHASLGSAVFVQRGPQQANKQNRGQSEWWDGAREGSMPADLETRKKRIRSGCEKDKGKESNEG